MLLSEPLPETYHNVPREQLLQRIAQRKEQLGDKLVILGHHYQRDEVIQFADFRGDSLKLAQTASQQKDAEYIVFCGVHFMAESADILTTDKQMVVLPNMLAGCAMAEMAEETDVAAAIEEVTHLAGARVIPITYVNSTAASKAITAKAGGACCTSSNVRNVFEWALRSEADCGGGADKIFAIPDEHLGRNTAVQLGYSLQDCIVYDPQKAHGGLTAGQIRNARFILWKGHCYVHQLFKPEDIEAVRKEHEDITVIVHPECPYEIVQQADASGSTAQIIEAVSAGKAGSAWAVGTESNLVNRLAKQNPDKFIRVLSDAPARCFQMARIDLPHLLWALDSIAEGSIVNQVSVDAETAKDAIIALQRMIDIKAVKGVTPTDHKS